MTLRLRLSALYAVVLGSILLVVAIVVWLQYAAALRRSVDEVLEATAGAAVDVLGGESVADVPAGALPHGIYLVVFDAAGATVFASPGAPALSLPPPGASTLRLREGAGDAVFATPAAAGRTVVAGTSLAQVDADLGGMAGTMALVGGAEAILGVIGGWWLAGRALAPVARLAREADAIGSSELDRRLAELEGDDELGTLARTLNRMLARVEESVRRQRAFVMGASHDLRTPIATLRTELELALLHPLDGPALLAAVEAAHADAVRLGDLANGLLRLAAAEPDGRRLEREEIALARVIEGGVALARSSADARGVTIAIRAPDVVVHVDRTRLVQAIANLLTNAVRHSPPGEPVDLNAAVDAEEEPPVLRVEVLDLGPGIPADDRSSLFEPFARARPVGSTGAGLGLATAAAAIHAHGGAIGYEERPGGGARFWFWVPA